MAGHSTFDDAGLSGADAGLSAPDGGTGTIRLLSVGCGCDAGPATPLFMAPGAIGVLARARRRRR